MNSFNKFYWLDYELNYFQSTSGIWFRKLVGMVPLHYHFLIPNFTYPWINTKYLWYDYAVNVLLEISLNLLYWNQEKPFFDVDKKDLEF